MSTPTPTENMVILNVRAPAAVRERLETIAAALTARDLNHVTVSDALRTALGRGIPELERELGLA